MDGPIAVAIPMANDFGRTTVYEALGRPLRDRYTRDQEYHMVLLTGFILTDLQRNSAFQILNSHGKKWGNNGFGLVAPHLIGQAYFLIPLVSCKLFFNVD